MIEDIQNSAGHVIMGLQFQDRLSQNFVILKNISELLNNHIKDAINLQQEKNQPSDASINLDLAKKILENLKLGEVKDVFIDYLLKTGMIKDASEIGFNAASEDDKKQLNNDDIELF
jgi:hypothetical protein